MGIADLNPRDKRAMSRQKNQAVPNLEKTCQTFIGKKFPKWSDLLEMLENVYLFDSDHFEQNCLCLHMLIYGNYLISMQTTKCGGNGRIMTICLILAILSKIAFVCKEVASSILSSPKYDVSPFYIPERENAF